MGYSSRHTKESLEGRVLPVDRDIAEEWGRFNVPHTLPVIDSLLAATAKKHGLSVATRSIRDIARTGVDCVNPFEPRSD
ncbi:MAG: PIN domain-containing protein [Acidobacteria bacterium]|nr:PIN domain-containing protein [Acidobacteriota bacterium]